MLGAWIWSRRLARAPSTAAGLRTYRNWLAFLGRFALSGQKADLIATAPNFSLDRDGFVFGTLYEAQEDISIGPVLGPLRRGGRYRFMGAGSLPQDGITDYYFEAEDGTALNLIFESMRGSDVKAARAKLLNDRLLVPLPDSGARAGELATVRAILARLRRRNRVD